MNYPAANIVIFLWIFLNLKHKKLKMEVAIYKKVREKLN